MSLQLIDNALKAEGVTGDLAKVVKSIYAQESGSGKNTQTSNRGAVGGMQILPSTFKSVADKGWDINDPLQNARAGVRYIKEMNKAADGDLWLTAVGYYGGPGGIKAAKKGVARTDPKNPSYPSTFQYADKVLSRTGLAKGNKVASSVEADEAVTSSGSGSPALAEISLPASIQPQVNIPSQASKGPTRAANSYDYTDPWVEFRNAATRAMQGKQPITPEALDFEKQALEKKLIEAQLASGLGAWGGPTALQAQKPNDLDLFQAWGAKL